MSTTTPHALGDASTTRLRWITLGTLASVAGIDIGYAYTSGMNLDTELVRNSTGIVMLWLCLSALCHLVLRSARPTGRLRSAYRLSADITAVIAGSLAIPTVVTIATFLVTPLGAPLADPLLASFEQTLGIPHPTVYTWLEAHRLIPSLEVLYNSLQLQTGIALVYFLLIRRQHHPLWEYGATLSCAAILGIASYAFLPAIGPYDFYAYPAAGAPPPLRPEYAPVIEGLRSGALQSVDTPVGLIMFPSFHTVFAILLARLYRHERFLYPIAVLWNVGVVAATYPVGWHYLVDLPGGIACAAIAIFVVDRLSTSRPPRSP